MSLLKMGKIPGIPGILEIYKVVRLASYANVTLQIGLFSSCI